MLSLIVDSATKKLYVALVKDEKVLYENYQVGKNDHSKYILTIIEEALAANNVKVDDLDKLVVGIGPGSYTGVRMALTVLKMFASFEQIPLYVISTLFLMASNLDTIASPKIDARRGNVFGAIYDMKNTSLIKPEGLYKDEEINEGIIVTEDSFIVDPIKCINKALKVDNPDTLIPNYLRDTEAERNLK